MLLSSTPDFGGMRIYETMRQAQPDFFVHSGDNIYADGPIPETRNNWYPGQVIVPLLDLFLLDMRTYRGPNTTNDQTAQSDVTAFLGDTQRRWLERELAGSRAVWRVVAAGMPLGLVVPDGTKFEGVASGDSRPLGRELEIATLLSAIKRRGVTGVVWITADVHYTAAHRYDASRAVFQDFTPFWEFVAGPLNAGTFGPNPLDAIFGPQLEFQRFAPTLNQPPSAGLQFFGHVTIDAVTAVMTVRLRDLAGATRYSVDLEPPG